ncbi:pentatricopeptide repeat-containing protein At2g13600-like [Primulina huaijiensis]|uniref:pentatricopeptide repeat-containing protein At2g13600-like n=1 Tax=Primulina huaijiensis TaxID=1492673 RepID=UPI003CC76BFF
MTGLLKTGKRLKAYVSKCISQLQHLTEERLTNHGNALHGHLIKMGLASQKYIAVKLLIMYLDWRKSFEIDRMLKEFNGFNLVVHNCLINVNLEWGNINEACRLFDEMPERNEVSWTALISGLLKHGCVDEAMWYFGRNPFLNVFSWTAAISGFVQNRLSFQAIEQYKKMLRSGVLPNEVTFTSVIRTCGDLGDFELGKCILGTTVKIGFENYLSVRNSLITFYLRFGEVDLARRAFDRMEERDVISWTSILDMYVEMGDLSGARRIFYEIPEKNDISWSAMIARFSQNGDAEEALSLFRQMIHHSFKPNVSCYSSVINALASLEALQAGRNIHAHVLKMGMDVNIFVGSALVDLYSKCGNTKAGRLMFDSLSEKNTVCWNSMVSGYSLNGQLAEAKMLFDQIPNKNSISWNSLIAGYVETENFVETFEVFNEMILSGEQPSKSTFSSVLKACASLASLEKGRYAHGKAVKLGFQQDVYVDTALLDMYAKSGSIECSKKIFARMKMKNEVAWTAMIQGLAENGFAEESLALFLEIEETSCVVPNELMLLSVLFACSHCGLIDKGLDYFYSMEKIYGIKPNERHYTSVVDMVARSGRLSEAEKFIENMHCAPEGNVLAALLSGCRMFGDDNLADLTGKKMSTMVETKAGGYVLMSNIYASSGRWMDVLSTRRLMDEKGVKKSGGCSWIEVRNGVHVFYSRDETHPQSAQIHGLLHLLNLQT